jgi:ElaB/YqjD/DUF883 family membrane-anchored ribosome-binding protein
MEASLNLLKTVVTGRLHDDSIRLDDKQIQTLVNKCFGEGAAIFGDQGAYVNIVVGFGKLTADEKKAFKKLLDIYQTSQELQKLESKVENVFARIFSKKEESLKKLKARLVEEVKQLKGIEEEAKNHFFQELEKFSQEQITRWHGPEIPESDKEALKERMHFDVESAVSHFLSFFEKKDPAIWDRAKMVSGALDSMIAELRSKGQL